MCIYIYIHIYIYIYIYIHRESTIASHVNYAASRAPRRASPAGRRLRAPRAPHVGPLLARAPHVGVLCRLVFFSSFVLCCVLLGYFGCSLVRMCILFVCLPFYALLMFSYFVCLFKPTHETHASAPPRRSPQSSP